MFKLVIKAKEAVWFKLKAASTFHVFRDFFFSLHMNNKITWFYCTGDKKYCSYTVHALFMYCLYTVHGFHNTIHPFKNYFATVFSVFSFSFSFSNNKFDPNGPKVTKPSLFLCSEEENFKAVLKVIDLFCARFLN